MNKITKNYLKSFLKDLLISILMIVYLVFMFLVVNIMSNTPIQYYEQYKEVLKNSNSWDSTFNNMFVKWNFTYIGDEKKDTDASGHDYKTFDFINNLTDEYGKKYLSNDWYKIVYNQMLNWDTPFPTTEGFVNIKSVKDSKGNNANMLNPFGDALNQDIKQFTLFQNPNERVNKWKSIPLVSNNKDNKNLGDIFNPYAHWDKINFSLNTAATNELANINPNDNNNALGFNQTLLLENHYSSSGKSKIKNLDNPIGSSLTQEPLSELLSISFADNKKRNNMSQVFLQTKNSRMPKNSNEILINQQFAKDKGLKIGDKINLFGSNQIQVSDHQQLTKQFYTIVGYGLSLADSSPHNLSGDTSDVSFSATSYKYGNIYTTYNEFLNIKKQIYNGISLKNNGSKENQISQYSWYTNEDGSETDTSAYDFYFTGGYTLLAKPGIYNEAFNKIVENNYIDLNKINGFSIPWTNSYVYKEIINNKTNMIINFVILIFVSLFSFIFLNLIIKRDINNSERQLGIFKAMGYKTKELAWVYTYKTLITFLVASIVGYLLSIPLQIYSTSFIFKQPLALTMNSFNYTWWFLVILFLFVPLLFAAISFFINLKYIKKSPIQLIYNNNTAKNIWLLKLSKKIFVKARPIGKLKLSFSVQAFYKWLIIWIIFIFANVSLMLSSSAIDSIGNLVENNSLGNIYNNNVSTIINEDQLNINHVTKDGQLLKTIYDINDSKTDPFKPLDYKNINIKDSVNYWHNAIMHWNPIEISMIKVNENPYINIYDFAELIKKIQNNNNSIKKDTDKDKKLQVTLSYLYYNTLYNNKDYTKSSIVCLNQNVMDLNSNYNLINNSIISPLFSKIYNKSHINISGIDDDNSKTNKENFDNYKKYFKLNGINQTEFNKILIYDKKNKEIPVIISEKVAKLFNWKEGETITSDPTSVMNNFSFSPFKTGTEDNSINNIDLKIVGIDNNIYYANMITGYANLAKFYEDKNNKNYVNETGNPISYSLDNTIVSNDNYYPNEKSLTDVIKNYTDFLTQLSESSKDITPNPSINSKYFPIMINDKTIDNDTTIGELIKNQYHFWYNDFNSNIIYVSQTKESINEIYGVVKKVQVINTLFTYILVTILIVLSLALIIDENKRIIMLLKVVGYENKKINWVTTGNIIFVLLFSLIFGSIVSFFILKFIESFIWTKFHYLVALPLSISAVVEITLLTTIVSGIIWKVCMNLISKKKAEELSRYD